MAMPDWPTPEDVVIVTALPGAALDDPALDEALIAGRAECVRIAPRRFVRDDAGAVTGPDEPDCWYALCLAAALEYRARGVAPGGMGYGETGSTGSTMAGGDGWQSVRRLLGIGYYARPRVG